MELKPIVISPQAVKQMVRFAPHVRHGIVLAFPIVRGNRWEDSRNGEVRMAAYVPTKTITGKGKDRKVETGETVDSRVWSDNPESGGYFRLDVRDESTFAALIQVASKDGPVTISARHSWGTERPCTFKVAAGDGVGAASGEMWSLYICGPKRDWYCGFEMKVLRFDYELSDDRRAPSSWNDGETLPLYGVDQGPEYVRPESPTQSMTEASQALADSRA